MTTTKKPWNEIDRQIEALRKSISNNVVKLRNQARQGFFKFKPFSLKQKKVLTWWCPDSPVKDYEGIIADGAIRSGKTLCMSLSFVIWAMFTFDCQNFALCGKTIGSLRRNVLFWLKLMLRSRGYSVEDRRAENLLIVRRGDRLNYFYEFGGKDERSQDLIQGITLAGLLCDEVALMPESFVNQATARCSVEGSKFWFNCNPEGPQHWFYVNWIRKCRKKHLLYLHFTMDDNLSLSEETKARYRRNFTGVFYDRFILGKWKAAEGAIYRLFADYPEQFIIDTAPEDILFATIGIDFGENKSGNAFTCTGITRNLQQVITLEDHWRGGIKTPEQLNNDFISFVRLCISKYNVVGAWADSEAQTLMQGLRVALMKEHIPLEIYNAIKGEINVRIQFYTSLMAQGRYKVMRHCTNTIGALNNAVWDSKSYADKRLDNGTSNIDNLDSMEYSIEKFVKDIQNARLIIK